MSEQEGHAEAQDAAKAARDKLNEAAEDLLGLKHPRIICTNPHCAAEISGPTGYFGVASDIGLACPHCTAAVHAGKRSPETAGMLKRIPDDEYRQMRDAAAEPIALVVE